MKRIAVILGSKSDIAQVESGLKVLDDFKIGYDLKVLSAHRQPDELKRYIRGLEAKGFKVVIACAGLSAALPGVVSSHIDLPVIGVPLYSKFFKGVDSLLSVLQMPKGVPVACVTIGSSGAVNAAVLAAKILALNDKRLKAKLGRYKKSLKKK
jgi:phosphoribosylaminoimidazole carboxylase PurE protein